MTVIIPSEKVIGLLVRNREAEVAAWASRRTPWPKLDISEKRFRQARIGMTCAAVASALANLLLGRIDTVNTVPALLNVAAARLRLRADELCASCILASTPLPRTFERHETKQAHRGDASELFSR